MVQRGIIYFNKMKIDYSFKGIMESISYVIVGAYTWIDSTGISARIFTILSILLILDTILGVWKAIVVPTLSNPTSKKAKVGGLAKLIILIIPTVFGLTWGVFHPEGAFKIVNTQLAILAVAEAFSCLGNAGAIYTREEITEFDAITYVFKKSTDFFKKKLEKIFDDE